MIDISEIINDKIIENCGLSCSKCGEKINIEKINDIILNNDKITNYTNAIKLQIEKIINNYSNDLLSNINNNLKMINEEIKINNEIIFNLINNKNKLNDISFNDNNKKEVFSKEAQNEIHTKKDSKYLAKIRSNYIIKILFSHLYEKNKLNIIKHNKSIQNKIGIGLINYKYYKGIIIKYESKTEGIEYNVYNEKIRFEGEYLNGKRNGKGKEYNTNTGKLIFEGEYLNGKRNGKGKEYDWYGKLIFEDEYLNGEKMVK